jgi:sugar phosphate isomerase/epimerase
VSARVAVQLYSVREALADDPEGTIARVAQLGVDGVEVVAGALDPVRLRRLLDAHGLAVCAAHGRLPEGPADAAPLDELEALGTDLVIASTLGSGLPGLANEALGDADGVARAVERFGVAAEAAAARGLRVGYHNHWWEWEGGAGWEGFWSQVDGRVVAEVDAYWAEVAGQAPGATIAALGERAELLHLKDGPLREGEPMVALGGGAADVRGALAAGSAARWHVIELDEVDGDVFAALAESVRWLEAAR